MPEKDKKKFAALNHKVTVAEIQEAESELMKWQNEVAKADATMKDKTSKEVLSSSKPNIIPVRGTKVSDKTGTKTTCLHSISSFFASNIVCVPISRIARKQQRLVGLKQQQIRRR